MMVVIGSQSDLKPENNTLFGRYFLHFGVLNSNNGKKFRYFKSTLMAGKISLPHSNYCGMLVAFFPIFALTEVDGISVRESDPIRSKHAYRRCQNV